MAQNMTTTAEELKKQEKSLSEKMLLSDWNAYWLSLVKYRLRITTQQRYQEMFQAIIEPAFAGRRLCDINPAEAQSFFRDLRAGGMSVTRCSSLLSVQKLSLDYALNRRLISFNPFALVMLPRKFQKKTAILYDDDIRRMVDQFADHPMMPLYVVMLICGLRIGEALGLSWDKVDLKERTMEISQQLISYRENDKQIYRIVPYTKTGESRTICLPEIAIYWLRKQQCLQEEMKQLSNSWNSVQGLVFSDENGEPIHYHQAYYQFGKIMKELGREDVTLHSLRHTAAATVLYTTDDIAAQMRFLGHRRVASTMGYGGATLQAQRRFAEAIDAAFAEICAEGLGITLSEEAIARIRQIQAGDLIKRSSRFCDYSNDNEEIDYIDISGDLSGDDGP